MTHPAPHKNEAPDNARAAGSAVAPGSLWMQLRQASTARKLSWGVIFVPVTALAVWLGYESMQIRVCGELHDIRAVAHWFDPIFFQYTLGLGLVGILIVPVVPIMYTTTMIPRKFDRLHGELPAAEWTRVHSRLQRRSSPRFYLGATALTTIVVTLGVAILLLFKPVRDSAGCGVDFGRGANMLLLGPFMELPIDKAAYTPAFFGHLVKSLVGFQFGFLGAYIYFLSSVSRAYFTLDLTPETFIEGSLRIAMASVLALILSFCMDPVSEVPGNSTTAGWWLPAISFFFGFFPSRALAFLEKISGAYLKKLSSTLGANSDSDPAANKLIPLSSLNGMSYNHELRLEREGFDSVENLSQANAADLAVRTGFSYGQLRQWLSEAWLAAHLREDYPGFVSLTGITSQQELRRLVETTSDHQQALGLMFGTEPNEQTNRLKHKVAVVLELCGTEADEAGLPEPDAGFECFYTAVDVDGEKG